MSAGALQPGSAFDARGGTGHAGVGSSRASVGRRGLRPPRVSSKHLVDALHDVGAADAAGRVDAVHEAHEGDLAALWIDEARDDGGAIDARIRARATRTDRRSGQGPRHRGCGRCGCDNWEAKIPLPTKYMQEVALPEARVRPQGEISGYVYFEHVPASEQRVRLEVDLVDADSGDSLGTASIPVVDDD
jgi:hypothetical protein